MYQITTSQQINQQVTSQDIRVSITTSQTIELVTVSEILYLEGCENYCRIHFQNGDPILANQSLGRIYEELKPFGFYLCHKSYVVNMEHVIRYWRTGMAELRSGEKVPVARRRREGFQSLILK